jgi:hypothetical protein
MKRPASRISTVPGVMDDLQNRSDSNQISGQAKKLERHECRVAREGGVPELGWIGLASAGGAGLNIIGRVELWLGGGGGLLGLGEGAAVLGLDGPQPPPVVRVRPRRALDALRQLRRRRHWIAAAGRFCSGKEAAVGEEWKRGFGHGIYTCPAPAARRRKP